MLLWLASSLPRRADPTLAIPRLQERFLVCYTLSQLRKRKGGSEKRGRVAEARALGWGSKWEIQDDETNENRRPHSHGLLYPRGPPAMSFSSKAHSVWRNVSNGSKSCQSETSFKAWFPSVWSSTRDKKQKKTSPCSDSWIVFISLHKEPCTGNSN